MMQSELTEFLDAKVSTFFPDDGRWKSSCFKRESTVSEIYLPCHLRDTEWLSLLMIQKYKLSSQTKEAVKMYINSSTYFNILRNDYEQKIVKWQIHYMLNNGENWITDARYGGDFYCLSPMCDYAFRKGIVDTLVAIGMDIDAIEEGIEKNANIWRDIHMCIAFDNQYNPRMFRNPLNKENHALLKEADGEFKEKWLQYRRYQYYQNHKVSVDKYGIVTNDMQMTEQEAKSLALYLKQKSDERLQEIQEYNQRINHPFQQTQMEEPDFCSFSDEDVLSRRKENKYVKKLQKFFQKVHF